MPPVGVGIAVNAWMYLAARAALKQTNEPWSKHFPSHRSQVAWIQAYAKLARARGLPIWPVYVHWVAWVATAVVVVVWLLSRGLGG